MQMFGQSFRRLQQPVAAAKECLWLFMGVAYPAGWILDNHA